MKIPKALLPLVAAILGLGALHPSQARAQVTVSFFYDNLDSYGEWVQDPDYGYCWHPTNVDDNWAPYTDGYWAYTDGGWTWVSYEDYGGIVYHYGRWAHVPGEGWVWVPGYTWAPAWVSWRSSDDYVGWAPLPPEARWRPGFGFGGWVDARFDIGPGFYSFVRVGDFGAPALGAVIVNREQNVTIINNTTNITNITVNNSNVYTGGPSYARIAARSTRPIPTLKLVRQGDAAAIHGANGKILARQQGSQLVVLSPRVTAPASGKLPPPPKVAKTLTADQKADHGWDAVKDPQQREQMQAKFKADAGNANTPAKSVNPEDIKLVTEKSKVAGPPKNLANDETVKTKTPKKPASTSDLENAPAIEEPGANPAPSPKTGKLKKHQTLENPGEEETGGATPEPKLKKSKKAKTPADDTEDTQKHESGNGNLQPFMTGEEEKKPKPEKTPKDYEESRKPSEYTEQPGGPQGPVNGDEGGKTEKKKKKGKGEATPGE